MTALARLPLALLALFLLAPPSADAQLGRLRDRAQRAASDATTRADQDAPTPASAPRVTSMEKDSQAALAEQRTLAPLDFASSPMPPAVLMESVLRHLWILPTTGDLKLDQVSIAFPPSRDGNGDAVNYSEQMRFHVRMREAGGDLLMDRYYSPGGNTNPVFTLFQLASSAPINRRDIARLDQNDPLVVTSPGAYLLEFVLDDRVFWELPFEVVRMENTDPYSQAGPRYFLRGPWQDYGYLGFGDLYSRAERDTKLYWYAFTQLESTEQTRVEVPVTVHLYRDDRLVAANTIETVYIKNEKQLEYWPLRAPGASADLTKDDLSDGAYEIRYTLGDAPTRTFPFEVSGGEIVPQGRQVRETTDPTQFIEGINESWWLTAR